MVVGLLTVAAEAVATVLMLASIASSSSSTAPLGLVVLPFVWIFILLVGALMGAVAGFAPRHRQPLLLALTVLPLLAGIAAVGVPEALQHHYRSSWDSRGLYWVSIASIPLTGLAAWGAAAGYRLPTATPAATGVAAATLAWATFLQGWTPGWCPNWCQSRTVASEPSPIVTAEERAGSPPRGRIEATATYKGREFGVLVWRRRGRLCWLGGRPRTLERHRLERGGSCVRPQSLARRRVVYTRTMRVDRNVSAAELRRAFLAKRDVPGVEIVSGVAAADTSSLRVDGKARPRLLPLSKRNRAFITVYELSPRGQWIKVAARDGQGFRSLHETFAPPLREALEVPERPVRRPLRRVRDG